MAILFGRLELESQLEYRYWFELVREAVDENAERLQRLEAEELQRREAAELQRRETAELQRRVAEEFERREAAEAKRTEAELSLIHI